MVVIGPNIVIEQSGGKCLLRGHLCEDPEGLGPGKFPGHNGIVVDKSQRSVLVIVLSWFFSGMEAC